MRDRHCQHPGCDTPAERCEINHITPYEHGGPTTQDNGDCRCPHTTAGTTDNNRWPPDPAAGSYTATLLKYPIDL